MKIHSPVKRIRPGWCEVRLVSGDHLPNNFAREMRLRSRRLPL
jgi:hypothetical protein